MLFLQSPTVTATGLTVGEIIALAGVAAIVVGWLVSALMGLLKNDRQVIGKQDEELHRQVVALWKSHDDIRRQIDDARRDLAVMDDRIQNTVPDGRHWDQKLESVRNQLESKLDRVLAELKTTQIQLAKLDVAGGE